MSREKQVLNQNEFKYSVVMHDILSQEDMKSAHMMDQDIAHHDGP